MFTKWLRNLDSKTFREKEGIFVVEGVKMVREAIHSGYEVLAVYTTDVTLFPEATVISEKEMSRITLLNTHSPALAVLERHDFQEDFFLPLEKGCLYLGLDAIRDPGNLGTIIRVADWFGIQEIYASPDCVDRFNQKVIQASMGSIFRIPVVYIDLAKLLDDAKIPVWGTALEGESIYQADLSGNGIILIGNEAHGLSPALRKKINRSLYIPSSPRDGSNPESLNAAVAAAIVCSEFRRR